MTWITDENGRRWVEAPARQRRASPKKLRFKDVKVGDQLQRPFTTNWISQKTKGSHRDVWHFIVTDLWFDPVRGQENEIKGRMVAVQRLNSNGEAVGRKRPHTIQGLASNGYHFAEMDYVQFCKDRLTGFNEGKVVGIEKGQIIRKRPKTPGRNL